ncbi:hypothetical protein CIB48_g7145 [Xylaria polymorpha]|nr:hypothetical protein CIB48_g7145 [Xylaria polymorpha]
MATLYDINVIGVLRMADAFKPLQRISKNRANSNFMTAFTDSNIDEHMPKIQLELQLFLSFSAGSNFIIACRLQHRRAHVFNILWELAVLPHRAVLKQYYCLSKAALTGDSKVIQLRKAVVEVAENKELELKALVLSYPNYLHTNEGEGDFDKYMDTYIGLLQPIWGDIVIETANEGQAIGLYICERFEDPFSDVHRGLRNRVLFDGLSGANGINLVIVDIGSSTLNVQRVTVYFDEQNKMIGGQSNVLHGSATGGSGMSNEAVSVILKERDLTAIAGQGQLREGELAALLASFEEQKKELDYMHYEDVMYLRGRSPNRTFPLPAEDAVKACRDAFTAPLAFLTTELRQVAQLGLALSYTRMPRPHEAFETSAIGSQKICGGIGMDEALFLFGKESRDPPPCLVGVSPRNVKRLELSLVCDPNYYVLSSATIQPPRPLSIGEGTHTTAVTYDLGWKLSAAELPTGTIAFTARGTRIDSSHEHIPFRLTYYKLGAGGSKAKHRKDRQWLLMLKTDPVTKLLKVGDTIKLPMWCSSCN